MKCHNHIKNSQDIFEGNKYLSSNVQIGKCYNRHYKGHSPQPNHNRIAVVDIESLLSQLCDTTLFPCFQSGTVLVRPEREAGGWGPRQWWQEGNYVNNLRDSRGGVDLGSWRRGKNQSCAKGSSSDDWSDGGETLGWKYSLFCVEVSDEPDFCHVECEVSADI